MEKKSNFVSAVALGNFNPAILTPSFLAEKCEFKSEVKPKGTISPITTVLDFGNINFLIDIERFQIREGQPKGFNKTKTIKLMIKYLEVLSYTPVSTMGLNFNVDITMNSKKIIEKLNDKNYLLKVLKAKQFIYTSKEIYLEKSTVNLLWELSKHETDKNILITVKLANNIFKINYNSEINNIMDDIDKRYYLDKNYDNIHEEFQSLIKSIFD